MVNWYLAKQEKATLTLHGHVLLPDNGGEDLCREDLRRRPAAGDAGAPDQRQQRRQPRKPALSDCGPTKKV